MNKLKRTNQIAIVLDWVRGRRIRVWGGGKIERGGNGVFDRSSERPFAGLTRENCTISPRNFSPNRLVLHSPWGFILVP